MRFVVVVISFVALAACTYPYRTPEVSKGGEIRGAADYLRASGGVRIILSHGMCSYSHRATDPPKGADWTNWVGLRAKQVADAIGVAYTPLAAYPATRTYGAGADKVERYDVKLATSDGPVDLTFLIWGRIVDRHRAALEFENTSRRDDPGAPIRAPVNAALKRDLMNRCLIDAVVYLGRNGDPIRAGMREALCDTLGGQVPAGTVPGRPGTTVACTGARPGGFPTVLVPESLGSTVMFEAYRALGDGPSGAAVARSLASVRAIFLASNQVAFLARGSAAPEAPAGFTQGTLDPGDALEGFLALLRRAPAALSVDEAPVQVVAITDPNDALGYRLDLGKFEGTGVEARNVLVSNTGTILGLLADPIAAHRNTARPEVFTFIAEGTRPAPTR